MLKELTKNNDMVAMLNDMKDFYFLACLDLKCSVIVCFT